MKARLHRCLLGLILFFLIPVAAVACCLLLRLLWAVLTKGPDANSLKSVIPLMIAPALACYGVHLFRGLKRGFHAVLRRRLLAFHLGMMIFISSLLMAKHGGRHVLSFQEQSMGITVLSVFVLSVLFSSPEPLKPEAAALTKRSMVRDRGGDFIAWLASRIR